MRNVFLEIGGRPFRGLGGGGQERAEQRLGVDPFDPPSARPEQRLHNGVTAESLPGAADAIWVLGHDRPRDPDPGRREPGQGEVFIDRRLEGPGAVDHRRAALGEPAEEIHPQNHLLEPAGWHPADDDGVGGVDRVGKEDVRPAWLGERRRPLRSRPSPRDERAELTPFHHRDIVAARQRHRADPPDMPGPRGTDHHQSHSIGLRLTPRRTTSAPHPP